MTAKTAAKTPAKTPEAPSVKDAASWDWADVKEAEYDHKYTRGTGTSRVDVETEVPEPIRNMIEKAYGEWFRELQVDGRTVKAEESKWRKHDFGDLARARMFIKLAQKYGKYRKEGQITVRAVLVKDKDTKEETSVVRFTGKPLEKRSAKRVPGSASVEK